MPVTVTSHQCDSLLPTAGAAAQQCDSPPGTFGPSAHQPAEVRPRVRDAAQQRRFLTRCTPGAFRRKLIPTGHCVCEGAKTHKRDIREPHAGLWTRETVATVTRQPSILGPATVSLPDGKSARRGQSPRAGSLFNSTRASPVLPTQAKEPPEEERRETEIKGDYLHIPVLSYHFWGIPRMETHLLGGGPFRGR